MLPDQAVYTALMGSAGLQPYIAESGSPSDYRVFAEVAPQDTLFPLVVYRMVADQPFHSLSGSSNLRRALVQVDCYAATYVDAVTMGEAVFAVLSGNYTDFKGLAQDRRTMFDENSRVFSVSQDFAVWI